MIQSQGPRGNKKESVYLPHRAGLAKDALIEGDATFTMIEVLKKDQPKVAAMLEVPLEKSRNLQNAFLYAQGARYVKALKERGGWATVRTFLSSSRPGWLRID